MACLAVVVLMGWVRWASQVRGSAAVCQCSSFEGVPGQFGLIACMVMKCDESVSKYVHMAVWVLYVMWVSLCEESMSSFEGKWVGMSQRKVWVGDKVKARIRVVWTARHKACM